MQDQNVWGWNTGLDSIKKTILWGKSNINMTGLNCSIDKKSAVFIQSGWYSTSIFYPWASHFGKISAELEENCRFFLIS